LLSTGPLKLWGHGHGLVGVCLNPALPATAQSATQLISKFRQTYSSTGYELQVRNTEEIEQLLVELQQSSNTFELKAAIFLFPYFAR